MWITFMDMLNNESVLVISVFSQRCKKNPPGRAGR